MGWSAEDEHKAALGKFWLWFLSEEELRDVSVGAPTAGADGQP